MSYRVDPNTLLFEDLTDHEAEQLRADMEGLVLKGSRGPIQSSAFQQWTHACGFDATQSLLMYSTAYPQRALLSLLFRKEKALVGLDAPDLNHELDDIEACIEKFKWVGTEDELVQRNRELQSALMNFPFKMKGLPEGVRFNLSLRLEATYTKVLKAFSQRLNEIDPGKRGP
jgi:hypothetical protein